ncbi:MAG: hypothetical protein EOM50_17045 [Erysipelotrichia bacterium]|nr:hypothetical protein [Erysipelotrichia bacterium]NCC54964.1 hypothetical protein [Erysipelotrichia bacterium]
MNKKGFISIYGALLLSISLSFSAMLLTMVKTSYLYHQDRTLTFVELKVIHKIKQDLLNYEESDEQFTYMNYDISLHYEDITCYIQINKQQVPQLKAKLVFDDIEEVVVSYTYE